MPVESEQVRKAAESVLIQIQTMWGQEHEFRQVNEKNFRHLDLLFYARNQKELEGLGFWTLGDIEDVCVKNSRPDPRTFLRILVNYDGTIAAAIYHAKPGLLWRLFCWIFKIGPLKVYELETEFTNGATLQTTICSPGVVGDHEQNAVHQHLDKRCPVAALLAAHTDKMNEMAASQDTQPVILKTLADVCDSQNRSLMRKRQHLEEIGWVSREYLVQQFGKDNDFLDAVYKEIERLVRKQIITGA